MAGKRKIWNHGTGTARGPFSAYQHRGRIAKRDNRELRRYLDISLGSLSEVSYLLRFSKDRGILSQERFVELDELRNRAGQLTWRLYESLKV
jgi:four helix bundle protein